MEFERNQNTNLGELKFPELSRYHLSPPCDRPNLELFLKLIRFLNCTMYMFPKENL